MTHLNYFIGNLLSVISKIIPAHLRQRLSEIILTKDMQWSIFNLKRNGFIPERVIDVGAFRGQWAGFCKRAFPSAAIMMIEPQISENKFLKRFCEKHPGSVFINALVGGTEKENVPFFIDGGGSSVFRYTHKKVENWVELPLTTLDCLTQETPFSKSQLIKLDVQGYELEVLKGASSILNYVEAIIMEVSLIPLISGAPLFFEVIQSLHDMGFCLYDICTTIRRPKDQALWQIDAVFVRSTSSLRDVSKEWE